MLVTVSKLAEWTGLERRTIQRRLSAMKERETQGRAKLFDSAEALRTIFTGEDGGRLDPGQEKALLDRTRREREELRLSQDKGDLIPLRDVDFTLRDAAAVIVGQFETLPPRLAPLLVGITDTNRLQILLQENMDDLRTRVADTLTAVPEQSARRGKPLAGSKA